MKNQILLILVGFLIISCNKNPNSATDISIVKGRLLDASNSKPITGGKVYLTDGASWILADSAITGADGSYQFQYNNKQYPYTEIWATAKNYLPNEILVIGQPNTLNLPVVGNLRKMTVMEK
mgnify:CR=1 FL=1|tara:strand:- start:2774 stop:3139 length:366 start_codon:yes stop_codon:yes gene_type:complete